MSSGLKRNKTTGPTCDSCHSRKIKCDRRSPCGNCLDSNVSCQNGHSKSPRNKVPKRPMQEEVTSLEARVDLVEDMIRLQTRQRTTLPGNGADYLGGPLTHLSRTELSFSPKSLAIGNGLCIPVGAPGIPDDKEFSPPKDLGINSKSVVVGNNQLADAQRYLKQELKSSEAIPSTRRPVLQSALELIAQLSQDAKPIDNARLCLDGRTTSMQGSHYPSIELLYWMLRNFRSAKIGFHALYLFKYISEETLKRMGLALINQNGDEDTLILYSICVNLRAAQFLNMTLLEEANVDISQRLRLAAEKYRYSAEVALSRVRLNTPSSMALLQAQLCGAFISRATGNSAACWTFTSAACKTYMDLELNASSQKEDDELYYCFVCCYILDKAFSMNLSRRSYFSGTEPIKSQDPVRASGSHTLDLMAIYLELARIQGVIAAELHFEAFAAHGFEQRHKISLIIGLLTQMDGLREKVDALDSRPADFRGLYMDRELHALDFAFYSVLTAIRRYESFSLNKTSIGKECVGAARKAILALRYLQGSRSDVTNGARLSFTNWTLLFYPLTPFLVLFQNVIATSNRDDFNLIKVMTEDLSSFMVFSPSIVYLKRLLSVFIKLSEKLLDEKELNQMNPGANGRPQKKLRTSTAASRAVDRRTLDHRDTENSTRETGCTHGPANDDKQPCLELQQDLPPWMSAAFVSTFRVQGQSQSSNMVREPSAIPTTLSPSMAATMPALRTAEPMVDEIQTTEAELAERQQCPTTTDYALNFSLPPEASNSNVSFWDLWGMEPSLDWLNVGLESIWHGEMSM